MPTMFYKSKDKSKNKALKENNANALINMSDTDIKFLLKKSTKSKILLAHGPSREEQVTAIVRDQYWTVLNSSILNTIDDPVLITQVNALKNGIQTYGPRSNDLLEIRANQGNTHNSVFHGHISGERTKCTYILEWAIVDEEKKQVALTNFDTHENFPFMQKPLSEQQIKNILNSEESKKILASATDTREHCIRKLNRLFMEKKSQLAQQGFAAQTLENK